MIHCLRTAILVLTACVVLAGDGHPAGGEPPGDPAAVIRSLGPSFEDGWNQLLVGWLRMRETRPDSARVLWRRCEAVAAAEPLARGTRIAAEALAGARRWDDRDRRLRIRAAEAESLGFATRTVDSTASLPAYREAIRIYRQLGERRREAVALGSVGVAYLAADDATRAEHAYHEALVCRRAIGDSILVGNTLFDLGECARRLLRFDDAFVSFEQSARVREMTGERAKLGSSVSLMGSVLVDLGRADQAAIECRRAVDLLVTPPVDGRRLAEGWSNLGRAALDAGDLTSVDRAFARAEAMAESLNISHVRIAVANNLADRDRLLGRFAEALARQEALRAAAVTAADSLRAANAIGRIHLLTGRVDHARSVLTAVRLEADARDLVTARIASRINLGLVERIDGRYDTAERWTREALELARGIGDSASVERCLGGLGDLALARRRAAEARMWYERAIDVRPRRDLESDLSLRLNAAASSIRVGDLGRAERELEAIVERSREPRLATLRSFALLNLADIDERRGQWARAVERGRMVVTFVDSLRALQSAEQQAIAVLADRHDEFAWYVGFLNRLDDREPGRGWGEEAFAWSERARARSLMSRIVAHDESARATPATLPDVQRRLGAADVVLYYSLGDSTSAVWAIRRDRWVRATLPSAASLRTRVEQARLHLADPGRSQPGAGSGTGGRNAVHPRLRELYDLLVGPVGSALLDARLVIVVPDGSLHRLPFEALIVTTGGRDQYMVERWPIAYAPSASLLGATPAAVPGNRAVAVGDVPFAPDGTPAPVLAAAAGTDDRSAPRTNLPHTRKEIDALSSLIGPEELLVYRGPAASRARLLADRERLESAWLVHVATHGEASPTDPSSSGLWLAPDSGSTEPSKLTVDDVLDLRLAARQVTLSACETGLGRLERGEGVLGLARAFLAAGAQSVVVSLWKVADASTATLMREFYREALRPGVSRAEALAGAKRKFIRVGGIEPFHWAPFVLIGEPGPMRRPGGGG